MTFFTSEKKKLIENSTFQNPKSQML